MINEESRQAFIKYFRSKHPSDGLAPWFEQEQRFYYGTTQDAWEAWQQGVMHPSAREQAMEKVLLLFTNHVRLSNGDVGRCAIEHLCMKAEEALNE
jgi:hypothetical protein